MAKNRKEAEKYILEWIDKLIPGGHNRDLYLNTFKNMNNKEFDNFINEIRNGYILNVIVGEKDNRVNIDRNYKIAKQIGLNLFQRLKVSAHDDLPAHTTKEKYLIYRLPLRRTGQLLSKGVAAGEDSLKRDLLTGAVTGKSQTTTMTYPEIQVLMGLELNKTIKELMVIRGGDVGQARALEAMLDRYGKASFDSLQPHATGVVAIRTMKSFFAAAHLKVDV